MYVCVCLYIYIYVSMSIGNDPPTCANHKNPPSLTVRCSFPAPPHWYRNPLEQDCRYRGAHCSKAGWSGDGFHKHSDIVPEYCTSPCTNHLPNSISWSASDATMTHQTPAKRIQGICPFLQFPWVPYCKWRETDAAGSSLTLPRRAVPRPLLQAKSSVSISSWLLIWLMTCENAYLAVRGWWEYHQDYQDYHGGRIVVSAWEIGDVMGIYIYIIRLGLVWGIWKLLVKRG